MATPVNITILGDDVSSTPVSSTLVEVYDTNGNFITSGTTDTNGLCGFTLPDASYDLRFYKIGVSILPRQPQRIAVAGPSANSFSVSAHVATLPQSTDPSKCTVSGYLLRIDGSPEQGRLVLAPTKEVVVENGVVVPGSRVEVAADSTGYVEFEVLRGLNYNVYFLHVDTLLNNIPPSMLMEVPNSPSAQLETLLFPLPLSATFSQLTYTLSLAAQAAAQPDPIASGITFHVNYSDGSQDRVPSPTWASATPTSSDPTIAAVDVDPSTGELIITGLKQGTVNITFTRVFNDAVFFSNPVAFTSDTLVVTVTA